MVRLALRDLPAKVSDYRNGKEGVPIKENNVEV